MSEINEEEVQNNSENKNIKQQPQVVPVIDHRLLAGKLTVYNWMEDTPEGCTPSEIVEVRFKNTRKGFYLNNSNLKLNIGDIVAVEAALGHDIGIVSLTGELVREQMRLKKVDLERNPLKKIYRKAKPHDIEKWQQAIALEHDTMIRSRVIAAELGLDMKIGDVEYQGDKTKAIFYYIANDRVDFRKLIKMSSIVTSASMLYNFKRLISAESKASIILKNVVFPLPLIPVRIFTSGLRFSHRKLYFPHILRISIF